MRNVVIFSVYREELSDSTNHSNTVKARQQLNESGIEFKNCIGMFKGVHEVSMVVDIDYSDLVEMIAGEYKQESILLVQENGQAILKYLNGNSEALGMFTQVEMSEAVKSIGYTKIAGKYWIAK